MARPKASAKAKGQSTLNTFIKVKKAEKKAAESEEDVEIADVAVEDEEDEAEEDAVDSKDTPVIDKKASPANSALPPISSIPAIFNDLVHNIPDIKKVAERVKGRKLRVATMCSGTESPLLALELIQDSIEELYGTKLDVEHVFSCEIEPFKQAYIERNFSPPILFRDICELGDNEATTAYGSMMKVPGDVDLLIAGTSCVDYSTLNNEKQDIDANGESGRTFRGMMSWVDKHRPPLVILENVCGAPWDKVTRYFEKNNYSAGFLRVDTKLYYVPHTRTRVYLLAVHQRNSSMPTQWKSVLDKLKRPASTTFDSWLLPTDDQRIHQARQKLVQESYGALDRRTGRTDWGRCESRHQRARLEEELGSKRPLTNWDDGGYCKLPDFAWDDWGVGQVERVWDLMDISLLRSAKIGVDPSFKTLVWNLSQNVDREISSKRLGVCPCLTPSMIPYVTNRGGPMVGLEALAMQGLPIDKLLLTRETEDQLADLAGNAMSTTVVGACILAALVVGKNLMKEGDDKDTYEEKAGNAYEEVAHDDADGMDVDEAQRESIESHISGDDKLNEQPLDLSTAHESSLPDLLAKAQASARLCDCEGRTDMTSRVLNRCVDCSTSTCAKCGGRPEHNYEPIDFTSSPRLAPTIFARELKSVLPMSLTFANVTEDLLEDLKVRNVDGITDKKWGIWRDAVLRACSVEQRFVELKRQEIWVAIFSSPVGLLELQLHPQRPEWRFFAKPEDTVPANSEIRRLLEFPIARMLCKNGLLDGVWEFSLPKPSTVNINIRGVGELVPSWEARLGLQGSYKDRMVYSQIEISLPEDAKPLLDRDISGVYTLFDKCGTATSALHKKEIKSEESDLPPLFFFLDPTRSGTADEDPFVFSISTRRYQFGETRPIVAKLNPKWRQKQVKDEASSAVCNIPCAWAKASAVVLASSKSREAKFAIPGRTLEISVSNDDCRSASALLVCKVPLNEQAGPEWPRNKWAEVDKVHERLTFKALAWLVERIKSINDNFSAWTEVSFPETFCECDRCAPSAPIIRWMKGEKSKVIAIEDPSQAGAFERALKNRPSPFVTQLNLDAKSGLGTVRIGVNFPSLIHRACSRLPSVNRTENPLFAWRLDTDFVDPAKLSLPKFALDSNRRDEEHSQPKHFKIPLRIEQLRSLTWMLKQESLDAPPFVEEEIAEAVLEPMGWRAQGRAQRPVRVRGGVLADEVGYGKTAITLGLIDCSSKSVRQDPRPPKEHLHGKIYVRGTLVVVPPHLTRQWGSEIKKFTGDHFQVVIISTASNINSVTVENIEDADIVVVASNLFHSSVYLSNLEAFAAGGSLPNQDGRYFNARLDHILLSLRDQVDRLRQEKGPMAAMKAIHDARKQDEEKDIFVQKRRLKGAKAREVAESMVQAKAAKNDTMDVDDDEVISPPSGKTVYVEIPRRNFSASASVISSQYSSEVENTEPPTSEAPSADESTNSKDDKPRLRKRTGRTAIIISDDEDVCAAPKGKSNTASKLKIRKSLKRKVESSDYDDSSAETEFEDNDDGLFDESEDDVPTTKGKKSKVSVPSRPMKKAKKSVAPSGTKKAKVEKDKAPRKLREETDPWKLKTKSVEDDWKQMHSPPLEMFYFERLVIDEYTYLDGKILSMVQKLTARRRWVLSGTPPIHDFASLKTIAAFLDIHLGVDDDGEGQTAQVKKRKREQTDVEKFHSFREVHSLEWHAHRHQVGQGFLDQFVRQNIAEIDEIPSIEKIELINLPAAERAIYLELEHHLRALDMTIKRGKKTESDREKRLAQALGESNSAEEALLKRCSHFDLDVTDEENAMKACDVIVQERTRQLEECKAELVQNLKETLALQKRVGKTPDETYFQEYVRVTREEGIGDTDATEIALDLLKESGIIGSMSTLTHKAAQGNNKPAKERNTGADISTEMKDLIWEIREKTHGIRRLTKELVGRVRSLRYFTVVRDLQRQTEVPPTISCPTCGKEKVSIEDIAVLSSCGHTGCMECVMDCAVREECVYARSGACKAAARVLNVVRGDTLGVDDVRDGRGRHFGLKLERIVDLIKNKLPKSERVLVFVQFPDLMKKVAEAFDAHKVQYLEIKGSASQKSKNLEKFQNNSVERVLLLNVMDESASGANLTGANHAIFLSPLLTPSQEIYDACETQAIGRLRRFGQTKLVHIWRFFTRNTIDIEIFEQRTKRKLT